MGGCRGLEPTHPPLTHAGGLVRLLHAVVAPLRRADLHVLDRLHLGQPGQSRGVATELIRRDLLGRCTSSDGEEPPEEPRGGCGVAVLLQQDVTRLLWVSSFGEGWARYAEALAEEMGLYTSDAARIQRHAWPADGMVVDPGIQVFGWSRESAVAYLLAPRPAAPRLRPFPPAVGGGGRPARSQAPGQPPIAVVALARLHGDPDVVGAG